MGGKNAGVYVSTAYSNCVRSKIDEVVYDPPLSYEDTIVLSRIVKKQNWSEEVLAEVTKKLIGKWPNTYTFTKAIAENVISEYANDLPFCIVRPSIVLSTNKEPVPGWTENLLGPCGVIAGIGLGAVHALLLDESCNVNLVPCDMACQAIIASAWETGIKIRKADEPMRVYNYVSQNPTTWKQFRENGMRAFFRNPSVYIVYYPCVLSTKSEKLFIFVQFFLQMIPALILDAIAKYRGHKAMMYKVYKVGIKHSLMLQFFSVNEWNFCTDKLKSLWNNMTERDREIFPFLDTYFNWDKYFEVFVDSMKTIYKARLIEQKVIKPRDDSLPNAQKHLAKLYRIHQFVKAIFFLFIAFMLYQIFYATINLISG